MRKIVSFIALGLALSFGAVHAADGDGKAARQEKIKACNAEAKDRKGEDRKAFMKECLGAQKAAAKNKRQEKMKACNAEAKGKKGEDRKAFMKECLSKKV